MVAAEVPLQTTESSLKAGVPPDPEQPALRSSPQACLALLLQPSAATCDASSALGLTVLQEAGEARHAARAFQVEAAAEQVGQGAGRDVRKALPQLLVAEGVPVAWTRHTAHR
jgi:hypothetical protein